MKPETLGGLSFKPVFFFNEVYLNEWINWEIGLRLIWYQPILHRDQRVDSPL